MTTYRFAKYHGLGNDFILVNGLTASPPPVNGQLAAAWCERHFGVGADGLILLLPSNRAACRMQLFNSDGSEAPMCGNGLRCLAMFARDEGLIAADEYTVETPAGCLPIKIDPGAAGVTVQMGRPRLAARDVPTTLVPGDQRAIEAPITVDGKTWLVTAVNTGNPQCVVFAPEVGAVDVCATGPRLERHPVFPLGANVMFAQVVSRGHLRVVPWERGAGATLACGTGACAAAVAGALTGRTERDAQVTMPGGQLRVRWDPSTDQVTLSGPAVRVFTGCIEQPDD